MIRRKAQLVQGSLGCHGWSHYLDVCCCSVWVVGACGRSPGGTQGARVMMHAWPPSPDEHHHPNLHPPPAVLVRKGRNVVVSHMR